MQKTRWSGIVPVLTLGLVILVVFLLLSMTEYLDALQNLYSILTPLTAFVLSVLGIHVYNRESETRRDQFHALFLWISIGLIMLSFSEIAEILVSLTSSALQIEVIKGLVQTPGLVLWIIGILQYLRAVNSSLEFSESEGLWTSLLVVGSLATLGLIAINALYLPWIGVIQIIVLSPIVVSQGMLVVITLGFVWHFRHGEVAEPLVLIAFGFLLYLIRTAHWAFTISVIGTPLNNLLAVEAYILFGAALALARNLGSYIE